MIGYTLKHVLELVPEATELVKKASLTESFPVTSPDDALASSLVIQYNKHISKSSVDYDSLEKVAAAEQVYGLQEKVAELTKKMVSRNQSSLQKQASQDSEETFMTKQAGWMGGLTGFKDIEGLVKQAEELKTLADKVGAQPNDKVKTYLCDGYMSKAAALDALSARFHLTKNNTFVKIAAALGSREDFIKGSPVIQSLCKTVTMLDKQAGLSAKGFDFYKETILTKSAATSASMVTISGKEYPLTKVLGIPTHHLDHYIGKDFSKELQSDPASAKAMVESLPADTQQILATILANC
jgi:hypothetical protein